MKKFFWGFAAGIAVVVFAEVLLFFVWTSPMLDVRVEAPTSAEIGHVFLVTVFVSNPHSEASSLGNVDIPNKFFDSFEVVSVSPRATSESPVGGFGSQTWYFDSELQPLASGNVVFEVKAIARGRHVIEFEVCNSTEECSPVAKSIEIY